MTRRQANLIAWLLVAVAGIVAVYVVVLLFGNDTAGNVQNADGSPVRCGTAFNTDPPDGCEWQRGLDWLFAGLGSVLAIGLLLLARTLHRPSARGR